MPNCNTHDAPSTNSHFLRIEYNNSFNLTPHRLASRDKEESVRKLPVATLLYTMLFCIPVLAETAEDFTGRWIEQADDPQKISMRVLEDSRLEARFTLGPSDSGTTRILRVSGNLLLDENGQPVFSLESGKLRQHDSNRLVLFVQIRE